MTQDALRTDGWAPTPTSGTMLVVARAGYAIVVLARPDRVAGVLLRRGLGPRERVVARVLATRQLAQALGSGANPGYPVLALGVPVDLAHAVSMLGLGLLNRRHRRAALTDAVIAAGFALAGGLAARSAARPDPEPAADDGPTGAETRTSAPYGPDRLRQVWADRLGRLLVPGYPPTQRHARALRAPHIEKSNRGTP